MTFTLPRSFDSAGFLPRHILLCADDARWLVSTILRKMANRDTDPWGWTRLHSTILRRVMGNHTCDIIRALEQGAIETAPYYAGVKCMGYANAERPCRDCWPGSARLDTCPALQRLPAVGLSRRAYDRLAGFSSSSGARGLATLPQVNGATPFSCGLWHLGCRHPHRLAFPPLPIRGSGGFPQANAWEPPSQGTEVAT